MLVLPAICHLSPVQEKISIKPYKWAYDKRDFGPRLDVFLLFIIKKTRKAPSWSLEFGGAERDRTADLYTASVALSQLSYGPLICFKTITNTPAIVQWLYYYTVFVLVFVFIRKRCIDNL